MDFKKNAFLLLLLIVFFLVLFKVIYGPGTASKMDNLFRFHNCLNLLEENKLYSQYACWHGPILYYTYYLFKVIFGNWFVLASSVVLNALLLLLILYLVWKETNQKKFIIPSLLYLTLIVPLIMDFFSLAAELVASVYLLLGISLLLYWKSKAKQFIVSLLFTFSLLSSQIVLVPIVVFLAAYFYKTIEKPKVKNAVALVKNNFIQGLLILLPIIWLHVLFESMHKYFIRFVWLGFAIAKETSLFNAIIQTIVAFSTPNLVMLPLTVMLIVSLYYLFKARDIYLTTFFFSLLAITVLAVREYPFSDAFDVYLFYNNKFLVAVIFFIIGFSIWISKFKFNLKKAIIFSLILSILIYPGVEKLYLYRQTYVLEDLTMGPLAFLGENQTILSNDNKFSRYETNYKSLDLIRGDDLFIGIKHDFKFHEKWVNLTEEKDRVYTERFNMLQDVYQNISNNYYSSIIYGPFSDELDLVQLYYALPSREDPSKSGLSNLDNYCEIILPTTEHRCTLCKDLIRVFFREKEKCSYVMQDMLNYYADNFYKICRLNEITANIKVRENIAINGFYILDKCKNGGNLLTDYNDKTFRMDDFLNVFYLSLLIATVILFKFKRKLIMYILGIIIIILLPLSIYNDNFVSDYTLNETSYAYANRSGFDNPEFPANLKALETIHDASYNKPAVIGKFQQKGWIYLRGRYRDEP